jgi:hypothetical protein
VEIALGPPFTLVRTSEPDPKGDDVQAERGFMALMSFVSGLFAAVLLLAPPGDRWQAYASACVCMALMLLFGVSWAALAAVDALGSRVRR